MKTKLTGQLWKLSPEAEAFNAFVREASRANEIGRRGADDQEPADPAPDTRPVAARIAGSGDGGYRGDVGVPDPNQAANQVLRDAWLARRR